MNVIELACFIGLPSIAAFFFLIGVKDSIRLSLAIGFGSAIVSLFAVITFSYLYRLFRKRLPEKAPVLTWAVLAVILSASVALFFRIHHSKRVNLPNQQAAANPAMTLQLYTQSQWRGLAEFACKKKVE